MSSDIPAGFSVVTQPQDGDDLPPGFTVVAPSKPKLATPPPTAPKGWWETQNIPSDALLAIPGGFLLHPSVLLHGGNVSPHELAANLPQAGAGLGASIPGAGAFGGGAIGGAAGETLKRGLETAFGTPPPGAESPLATGAGVVGSGLEQGAYSKGGEMLGTLASKLAPGLLAGAKTSMARALTKPGTETFVEAANENAPALLEAGIVGRSQRGLQTNILNKLKDAGAAADKLTAKMGPNDTALASNITEALEKQKTQFAVPAPKGATPTATSGKLPAGKSIIVELGGKNYVTDPENVQALTRIEELQQAVRMMAEDDQIPYDRLKALKDLWQKNVAGRGGLAPGAELPMSSGTAIKGEALTPIRKELANLNPELADLNRQRAALIGAADKLSDTRVASSGQGALKQAGVAVPMYLGARVMETPFEVHPSGGLAMGYGSYIASKALMNSTAWNTLSAQTKFQLAKLLAAGDPSFVQAAGAILAPSIGTETAESRFGDWMAGKLHGAAATLGVSPPIQPSTLATPPPVP